VLGRDSVVGGAANWGTAVHLESRLSLRIGTRIAGPNFFKPCIDWNHALIGIQPMLTGKRESEG